MVQEVVCAGLGVGDVAGPVGISNEPSSHGYGGGFEGDHCDLLGLGACQVAFSRPRLTPEAMHGQAAAATQCHGRSGFFGGPDMRTSNKVRAETRNLTHN